MWYFDCGYDGVVAIISRQHLASILLRTKHFSTCHRMTTLIQATRGPEELISMPIAYSPIIKCYQTHPLNLQASERHCLADSYLPPSLLAAPAAIADTNHYIHHGRPKPAANIVPHRPTSVRTPLPYQACQAAILGSLGVVPSFSGHVVGVAVSVPTVSAVAKRVSTPLLVVDAGCAGDSCDARCGYAADGLSVC